MNMIFMLLPGAAFSVSGVLLLRAAWRSRRAGNASRRRWQLIAAWALIALAFFPWAVAYGADKGATQAIMVFMLAGTALVLRAGFQHNGNGRRLADREARNGNVEAESNAWKLFARRTWVFLLAGPIALVASIALAAFMFAAWDVETGSAANRLAATLLFVPFAWAWLAILATYDVSLRYRSGIVCALLIAGVAGTFSLGVV